VNQQIRFYKSFDGTRIAYAITGEGPPLVKAPHWLTHLEYEFQSPIWRPWIEALSKDHSLLRMDERACGLSDWQRCSAIRRAGRSPSSMRRAIPSG
jgi:hypothetical protein